VCGAQASETRGLVAAARLDTDETVLNNVDTADTVTAGDGVGSQEDVNSIRSSLLLAVLGVLELNGKTLLEVDGEILRLVGSGKRVDSELPHVGGRSDIRVLQNTSLIRAVGQILVHTPGLGLGGSDGDTLLSGVGKEIVATGEALVETGVTPRSDDLDVGLESVEGELETDLIVTLAGTAVGDSKASFPLGNFDLCTSNDGTSQRGTEEVDVLVDGVASNSGEAEFLNKLAAKIDNFGLDGTELQSFLLDGGEVL
jgi:hypothetical protein